jgi:hypothetical protein
MIVVITLFGLSAVATLLAWLIAWRREEYRPIAWFLTYGLGSDVVRQLLRDLVLAPGYVTLGGAPATGWLRVAFHVEQALFVGWPVGIAALSAWIFTRRRPWPLALAYAAVVAVLILGHPAIRQVPLSKVYLAVELAALCISLGCLILWLRSSETRGFQHFITGVLIVSELVMIAGPYSGSIYLNWDRAWAILLVEYLALITFQGTVWYRMFSRR